MHFGWLYQLYFDCENVTEKAAIGLLDFLTFLAEEKPIPTYPLDFSLKRKIGCGKHPSCIKFSGEIMAGPPGTVP